MGDIMDIELSDSSKNLLQQIGFIHSLPLESIAIEEQTEPVSIVLISRLQVNFHLMIL